MTIQDSQISLPLPAFAIPVQVSLDQKEQLNVLEKAILRLTKLKPRTLDELSDLFSPDGDSLSPEMIETAIDRLSDLGWLNKDPNQDVFSANIELDELSTSLSFSPGWVLLMQNGRFAQTVILGAKKPARILDHELLEAIDFCVDWAKKHRGEQPKAKELRRELSKSISRQFKAYALDGESSFEDQSICNIQLDEERYNRSKGIVPTVVWTRIDLLQKLSGPPLEIAHEPDFMTTNAPTPIVDDVIQLIRNFEPVNAILERFSRELHRNSSEVLRFTDIQSTAELNELVLEYRAELVHRTGIPFPPKSGSFEAEMNSAWEWYVIARANSRFESQAFDCVSHGSELITRQLFQVAEPHLDTWWKTHNRLDRGESKKFKAERDLEWHHERVGLLRLGEMLKPRSLKYIQRWVSTCHYDKAQLGAGKYLLYWLLPLFLLDDAESEAYGKSFLHLQKIAPNIIDDLSALVETRNSVFHSREEELMPLNDLNLALYRVWSSLTTFGFLATQV